MIQRNSKGVTLIIVIMITTILLLLSTAVITVTAGANSITNSIDKDKLYFWEAESGINIGLKKLRNLASASFTNGTSYSETNSHTIGNNTVEVLLEKIITRKDESWQITSTVYQDGKKIKKLRLKDLKLQLPGDTPFFMRGGMSDNDLVALRSSDEFYGPAHFQKSMRIIGSPKFHGPVTSSSQVTSNTVFKDVTGGTSGGFSWQNYIVDASIPKNIFAQDPYIESYGKGILDGYTLKSSECKINSAAEMKNKYITNSIFKEGYTHSLPEKDIPVTFDSFSDVLGTGSTMNLSDHSVMIADNTTSLFPNQKLDLRLTFLADDKIRFESRNLGALYEKWDIIADNVPLSGTTAIAIPKTFFTGKYSSIDLNNVHIRGEYSNSMTIVTEEANIVIDGDLYPTELRSFVNESDISKLQKKVKDVEASFALISGISQLESGTTIPADKGNILLGQEAGNSSSDGDILITAGLYAANKFGVGGGDLNITADGYLTTGFGATYFEKLVSVKLLGNVMMNKITHFTETNHVSGIRVGMAGKFIFDPRGTIPKHINIKLPSTHQNTEIALKNSVIWEVL